MYKHYKSILVDPYKLTLPRKLEPHKVCTQFDCEKGQTSTKVHSYSYYFIVCYVGRSLNFQPIVVLRELVVAEGNLLQ